MQCNEMQMQNNSRPRGTGRANRNPGRRLLLGAALEGPVKLVLPAIPFRGRAAT